MAEIVANGVRLHLQRLTPRWRPSQLEHPVVFVHGLVMDNLSSFYFTLGNPMANAGADVILYDQRGHGLSERPPTGYRLSDSVADLTGLLDSLGIDGPVHLVGNSYGGTVALGFAAKSPDRVASMVLIEARIPIAGWAEEMTTAINKIQSDLTGEFGRWVSQSRNRARLAARGDKLIHQTTFINDLITSEILIEDQLPLSTAPVLAVYGSQSDILHHGYKLHDLLSQYALTILPGVNHLVLTEAPEMVRAIVLDWFMTKKATMLMSPM